MDRQLTGQTSSTPFMDINDGYISKKVTFDTQDSSGKQIDRLTSMLSKWQIKMKNKIKQFKPKHVKAKGKDRREISMIKIMAREMIKIDIGQIAEKGEYHSVVEYNMDRIIGTEQGVIRII